MDPRRIDFTALGWESPMRGVRQKAVTWGTRRVRLVEYQRAMEPHWCERGHYGYVLSGTLEVEFPDGVIVYGPGNGVCMPAGHEHRHRARVLSDTVQVIFVEDA